MGSLMTVDIVTLIGNYGFPIVVALFLLFEYREIRKSMLNEIHSQLKEISETERSICETQKSFLETQKQILETQKQILEIEKEIMYMLKKD